MYSQILITGGAGFVGSNLALALKRDHPKIEVRAFDNLKRRGSELTLPRLRAGGVTFVHGDIRSPEDLAASGSCNLLIECSAEPSVHAGYDSSPDYLIGTNLIGTVNCMEHARRHGAAVVFMSTSRVYPIGTLRDLPLVASGDRMILAAGKAGTGWSTAGISEDFPLTTGSRSLYGATKLASEILIEEYRAMYGMPTVINRCGLLTGPWQMGKVDQGVVVLWAARHAYGGPLSYMGFGGTGHQVRDILHVADLYRLLIQQLAEIGRHSGKTYNVGGGNERSVSLRELTDLCQKISGREVRIGSIQETRAADVPYYVSDCSQVRAATGWQPEHSVKDILEEIFSWLAENRKDLESIL